MQIHWPELKKFDREHLGVFVAGIVLLLGIGASLYIYFTAKPNHTNLSSSLQAGDYLNVISKGEDLLARNPDDAALARIIAGAYLSQAKVTNDPQWSAKAIAFLTEQNAKHPNDAELIRLTGYYYFSLGQYEKALNFYQQASLLDPNNAVTWSALGQIYDKNGDYKKAKDAYYKALALNPDDTNANIGKIKLLFRDGKADTARTQALAFLSKTKDALARASTYEMLGLDALGSKQNADAEKYFNDALILNPNLPVSLASFAYALLSDLTNKPSGNMAANLAKPEAMALLATQLKPNYAFAWAVLSRIEKLKGDAEKAKEYGAMVLSTIAKDDITPEASKAALKKSFSTTTPAISNIKIISKKQIFTVPTSASSTGVTIKKSSQ